MTSSQLAPPPSSKDMDILSFAAGLAAGALIMYYLDTRAGGRRRALVRDKIVAASHDAADLAKKKGKRAADRLGGIVATGHLDRVTSAEPESEQQLHDRIRARLGRVVSHPKSVDVAVDGACVRLSGHILTKELDGVLDEVKGMAGVEALHNQLMCHDSAQGIPELQGRTEPAGRKQRHADIPSR